MRYRKLQGGFMDALMLKNRGMSFLFSCNILLSLFIQMGCSPNNDSGLSNELSLEELSSLTNQNSENSLDTDQRIYLYKANLEQIKPHKSECSQSEKTGSEINTGNSPSVENNDTRHSHGNNDKTKKARIYIEICHVPPGNPAAAHKKIIPLQALRAHLKHGHHNDDDNDNENQERDYLGPCANGNNEDEIDDGDLVDEVIPPADTTIPPADTTIPPADNVIPLWCQAYLDIDANCDGYDDVTGDPLL
jgi:hypothetical protein